MKADNQSIIWRNEANQGQFGRLDRTSESLLRLSQAGALVPPAFLVSQSGFLAYLTTTKLDRFITKTLQGVTAADSRHLAQAAHKIQEKMKEVPVPAAWLEPIALAYGRLVSLQHRISAGIVVQARLESVELNQSFPGLPILRQTALAKAVSHSYSQIFSPEFIAQLIGGASLESLNLSLCFAVQPSSESSGLLSIETLDSQVQANIRAILGNVEPLLHGLISPDRYLVDVATRQVLTRDINKQDWQVTDLHHNKHIKVATLHRAHQKVDDPTLQRLAVLAGQAAQLFRSALELTWVLDSAGTLWITDLRPLASVATTNPAPDALAVQPLLAGKSLAPGRAIGPIRFIHRPADLMQVQEGEIIVCEVSDHALESVITKIAGVITESGHSRSQVAAAAKKQGIPAVMATSQAKIELRDGLLVTLDGTAGVVYRGKALATSSTLLSKQPSIITGTKLYLAPSAQTDPLALSQLPVEGLCLSFDTFFSDLGLHPRALMQAGQSSEIVAKGIEWLEPILKAVAPRPVLLSLSDRSTDQLRQLEQGPAYEIKETNPRLGYRGAARHLQEPDLLKIELDIIRRLRNEYSLTNLHLMLPFVRTFSEFVALRHLVIGSGLTPDRDFQLWIRCDAPATVMLMHRFCQAGEVQGVFVDLDQLTELTLGVDRDHPVIGSLYDIQDEAIQLSLGQVITTCRAHAIPTLAYAKHITQNLELVEILVRLGLTGLVVHSEEESMLRPLIASAEQRLILNHVIEEVHTETAPVQLS